MSGAERNSWSREDTEFCPLCCALDSKAHRLYVCPALADQRQDHLAVLAWVREHRPHWTHLAYVAWPEEASVLQLLFQQLRPPSIASPAPPWPCICLFTDGSAVNTSNVLARLTAWSVVLARCPEGAPDIGPEQLASDRLTASFAVLAQGTQPGAQSVPRAELAAIAWASAWSAQRPTQEVQLYSDCQSAVDIWCDLQAMGWPDISQRANADLLQHAVPRPNFRVHKVKAHRTAAELPHLSPWELWLTAGNEADDAAAKTACRNIPSAVQDVASAVARASEQDMHYLQGFCRAVLDIGPVDMRLREAAVAQQQRDRIEAIQQPLDVFFDGIRTWRIPFPGASSLPETWEENWEGWVLGLNYGSCLLRWVEQLRWPVQPVPPQHDHQVSYLELLLSFVSSMSVVPLIEDSASPGRYLPVTTAHERLRHVTLRMLVETFRASLKRLGLQLGHSLLPFTELSDVVYMRLLQFPAPCPGIAGRPQLPGTAWTQLLQDISAAENPVLRLITLCADFQAT